MRNKKPYQTLRGRSMDWIHAPKKTKANYQKKVIVLLMIMFVLISLFFIAFQQYQKVRKSYLDNLNVAAWSHSVKAKSDNEPTTLLVVGMSFLDSGRIAAEESVSWNLIKIDQQQQKSQLYQLSSELELDDKPLRNYHAQMEMEELINLFMSQWGIPIHDVIVVHLDESELFIDQLGGIPLASLDLGNHDGNTLHSGRQVIQYNVQLFKDTDEKQRFVDQVLKEMLVGFNQVNFINWDELFKVSKELMNTSLQWPEWLNLFYGSLRRSLDDIELITITSENLARLKE